MEFHQALGQGQAEAGALLPRGARALELHKLLKKPREILWLDADAGVGDAEL
jgi:hypothetical protein